MISSASVFQYGKQYATIEMGNNNASIHVTFDRAQPAIYYAGETISGQVHFIVPERTTAVDYIFLTVTGVVGFTTMRTARIQNGQTERRTDCHDIKIFGEKVLLGHAFSTQQQRIPGRVNDTRILEQGEYAYPFAVPLPEILPPTIHPKDYPFVRYELRLFVEKKWYHTNSCHCYPLRIYPRVNLLKINNALCAVRFDTKRTDITVNGVIQRSGLVPGEQTMLSLEIHNPNHLIIKRVDVCLIQRYDIEQCPRRLEINRVPVPQILNVDDENIQTTCPIQIPIGISPSYNYRSKGGRSAVHVNLHYDVKIEVKTKGLFSDFELQVPIIIGTDSTAIDMAESPMDLTAMESLEVEIDDDV